MNPRAPSRSVLLIAVTVLSALVIGGPNLALAQIGLVTSPYGPPHGQPSTYEPVGPFIDGIVYPQFLSTQDLEWQGLKTGTIDVYDFGMTAPQLSEYNSNICVSAPDAPAGIAPCGAAQAPIQHEITIFSINALDKWEIDMQTQMFPTNVLAFRQAVAWIVDKENFTTNFLGGLGAPIYTTIPAGLSSSWIAPGFSASSCQLNHCYGSGLPFSTRLATANAILNSAGFTVGTGGFRVDNSPTCATDGGPGCGNVINPIFYSRLDDPLRCESQIGAQLIVQN